MAIRSTIILTMLAAMSFTACIQTEIIPETLEPVLLLEPAALSLVQGQTYQLDAVYTDAAGEDQVNALEWVSSAPGIAAVNAGGLVLAVSPGQAWVFANSPEGLSDSVLVTVANAPNEVANVLIVPAVSQVDVGATFQFNAIAYNAANQEIPAPMVTWFSSDQTVLTIDQSGLARGVQSGTALLSAKVDGVSSLVRTIQVTPPGGQSRTGMFSGNMGYSVTGTATLKQVGTSLSLDLESNFAASNGPQLGVYLATTASGSLNTQNSVKLANLMSNTGMQTYSVPSGVGLNDYNFVVIYCIPFTVRFGTAPLN